MFGAVLLLSPSFLVSVSVFFFSLSVFFHVDSSTLRALTEVKQAYPWPTYIARSVLLCAGQLQPQPWSRPRH
jgi:hypothetical protein